MDLLKGFVFDLQRHGGGGITWATPGEYYIEIGSNSQSVNLTTGEFSAVNTLPAVTEASRLMLGFTVSVEDRVGAYRLESVKLYRCEDGQTWSDGVAVTAETYTGTIYTGALPEKVSDTDATYIFDAANYKLDTTGAKGDLEIDNFGTDDTAIVASGKSLSCYYNNGFSAEGGDNGATVRGIRDSSGGVTLVLTSGSMVVKGTGSGKDYHVGTFDNGEVTKVGTIFIVGDGVIASDGSVNYYLWSDPDHPPVITSNLAKPITIGSIEIEINAKYKVNGVEYTFSKNDDGVVFILNTPATDLGARAIEGLDSGNTLSFTPVAGNLTVSVNGKAYALTAAQTVIRGAGDSDSQLVTGTATLNSADGNLTTLTVANADGTATSAITAEKPTNDTNTSITVAVAEDVSYEISGLDNGEVVSINGTQYTYNGTTKTLLNDSGAGYLLDDGDIKFTLNTGKTAYELDTTNNEAAVYVGTLTGADGLQKITTAITGDNGTLYFDANGAQVLSGGVYTVTKATVDQNPPTYTLISTAATSPLEIDASGVTGLTVDFGTDSTGVQTLVVNDATQIISCKLGNGDIVKNGDTTYTATADNTTLSIAADGKITLTSGAVQIPYDGSVVTTIGTVTNKDTAEGHAITVAADGTVTPATTDADYTIALNDNAEVTINVKIKNMAGTELNEPMKYHGSNNAVIRVTKKAGESDTVTLTSGTVALGKDARIITDIGAVKNNEESLITVSKDGQTITTVEAEDAWYYIALAAEKAVTINGRTYTSTSGDYITLIDVIKAKGKTELCESLGGGTVSVKTNASVNTNIGLFTNKGSDAIEVYSSGTVKSMQANAESYEYRLSGTQSVFIGGMSYTNVDGAVIDVTKAAGAEATDLTVTLTAGSVAFRSGVAIVTTIGKITNNTQDDHDILTVKSDGTITTDENNWEADYTVEIKAGKTATLGGKSYTTPAGKTAEIRVVKDGEDYTTTLTNGAVVLGEADSVIINEVEYKAAAAQTTISVDNEQKVTLETGAVKLANGISIVANGVTVTNTATAELMVQAKNVEAIVATAADGNCSAVIGAGKKANIDGTTYTNASTTETATITKANGGTAVLTAGEVVVPSGGSVAVGNKTYTAAEGGATIDYNGGTAKLTAGAITLATGESFEMAGKGIVTNNGTANIAVDKDGNITWTATDDVSFTTKDSSEDTANLHTYKVKNGNLFVYNADSTDVKIYSAGASVTMATSEQDYYGEVVNGTPATGGDIHVAPTATTKAGAHYFNADGIELPDDNGFAIQILYTEDGANTPATIHVERPLTVKVNLTGVIIGNADKNKYATYTIKGSDFKGSGFNTLVEGAKTIISGEVTALTGNGTYDLAAGQINSITFAGKGKTDATLPEGATINLQNGNGKYTPVVVKEASADADINDTVIRGDGVVRGLDTGASVTANNITSTAGADNLSLSVMNNGLVTEDEKIAFTTESGGSFTFTSATSATNLKGVTAAMSEGTSVVGARGESESVTALSETGGEVKADANGDLAITKAGQYTALENGEIAVAAEGKVELRTGDNAVLFAGDSGNKVTGTYKGSNTAANVEATLTSTNAAASLTATKAGAKLTVHGTEYIATADNTMVCYGTNTAELMAGAVELDDRDSVAVGGNTYTAAKNGTVIDYNEGKAELTAGAITLATGESFEVAGKGLVTNNGTAAIAVDKDGNITWTATDDVSFTTKDSSEDTANLHTYKVKNGNLFVYNADSTDVKIYSAGASVTMAISEQEYYGEVVNGTPATGGDIHVAPTATTTAGAHYFNADGIELPDNKGAAILSNYAENGANAAATIDVWSPLTVKVNLTGANAKVTDNTGSMSFKLNGSNISGTAFTVDDNVITSANNKIKVTSGSITTSVSNAKIDMSAAGDEHKVTFTAATKTDGAEVTTQAGTITVTETGTGTATVIDQSGNVTGLDGDATVTGVPTDKTVTTTGDGKATINGMSFTLSKDGDGVTYTAAAKGISAFSGLRQGATLKLEDKLNGDEEVAIKHGGEIFKDIVSVDGIEFTMGKTDINVTLNQSGEQFTDDDGTTYRLDTAGSSIVVGENGITELVNGTKVTVTDAKFFGGTGLVTLEVKDNILIITRADGTTETYKQGDTNVPFTVDAEKDASNVVKFNVTGAVTEATEQAATEGLEIGGTSVTAVTDGMLVDKDGKTTTDESKATAKITITDNGNTLNYKAKPTSDQQELNIADTNGLDWNIDTSEARGRTQVGAGTSENPVNNAVNVTAGSGRSEVEVYSNADSSIKGGSGNLTATVGGRGDHHVTAGSGSRNELKDLGTGENVLTGGSGKNTFESSNENGKLVAGTGKNTFKTTKNVTNKVEGFTYGKDEVSIGSAITDYANFQVGEGTISYGGKASGGEVDVSSGTGTGSAYLVTVQDSTGKKTNVGWTGEDGGTLDASSETKPLVLIGSQNGDAKDFLTGGTGRDVIFAGESDQVSGGAGKNELHLSGSGISVGFGTAGARDEVTGFLTGFDESEADSIYLVDTSATDSLNLRFNGTDAVLKSGSTKMTLDSIQKNAATNAAELLIGGVKVAAIEKGTTATISEADYADVYFATGSAGLDFGAVSDDLTIDLSDKTRFRNIKTVKGGEGSTILMGGSGKTTLVSGGGDTSLWGGTGNALLVGAKDARDEFFFFGESGRDTIAGFEAGTENTSDVLNLFGSAITGIKGTSKGVEISTTEKSKVLLQGLKANDKIQWESGDAKGVAKIGVSRQANTFTYDEEVTNYFGGSKKDTLQVSGEDHSVWMENLGSSIEIIDASSSTGDNLLAGGHEAETIIGGRGSTSLWGGAGGNDVLTGGSGYNEFYFGKGEGADLITKSGDGDKVMLYNVKLEDVNGRATGLKDGSMVIALKDGSTLTLQNYDSHGATTFQLADGTYSYDRKTGSWQEMK